MADDGSPGQGADRAPRGEYDSDRDMEAFWAEARLKREPMKQKWYIPGLVLLGIASIPWYRTSGEEGRLVGGLPDWVWVTVVCTFGMAALAAVAVLRFWADEDDG